MKFTLNWLSSFVDDISISPAKLADKLTMLGLEVEQIVPLYQGLDKIIIARVLEVKKHPNADRLTVCQVDTGEDVVQVVCGAPNVRESLVTAMAVPGVRLPDGMKIKKAKVRGEQSLGMLCSARELGLGEGHEGIIELDEKLPPGQSLAEALGLVDTMIEVDLTPNRSDCASVLGIAREVAGFTGMSVRMPVTGEGTLDSSNIDFSLTIEEPELCLRYAARKLTNVKISPSPWWLQRRLLAVGVRPINNIVDITNFVCFEYGQPLHAFDFKTLRQSKIVVRCPSHLEKKFTTLDGAERQLTPDTLMICDGEGPVAIAGVMGGLNSEVTDSTTEIILESANFTPVSIRRTARRLNLLSEASYRFERGVDPDITLHALERAVALMIDLAGATVMGGGVDEYPGKKPELVLKLRVERVNSLLGISLNREEIIRYLESIEFRVVDGDDKSIHLKIPSFRTDIEREVDLIEEIARLVGYDEIPITMPSIAMDYPVCDDMRELRKKVSAICTDSGFFEAINYSFTDSKHLELMLLEKDDPRRLVTRILNPLTEEQAVMRSMLLPGLLENIVRNINHQQPDIRLFEVGKTFIQREDVGQPEERYYLCAVCTGERYPDAAPLHFSGEKADLFDIKGLAESILAKLHPRGSEGQVDFVVDDDNSPAYSKKDSSLLLVNGRDRIGCLGAVNKDVLQNYSIKQPVYFLELDLLALLSLPATTAKFTPLPRYPMVKRDIGLLVSEDVLAGDILGAIRNHKAKIVESVNIFDVYSGEPIEDGCKNVAISVTYRSAEKTLDDQGVDKVHDKIVASLMKCFGGKYRQGRSQKPEG
jgi:phenylalanyl-tRNA synthetase beta chain